MEEVLINKSIIFTIQKEYKRNLRSLKTKK